VDPAPAEHPAGDARGDGARAGEDDCAAALKRNAQKTRRNSAPRPTFARVLARFEFIAAPQAFIPPVFNSGEVTRRAPRLPEKLETGGGA
jgi:hypothetical protein